MTTAGVDLLWLPLGAGGRVVQWSAREYERLAAARGHRSEQQLFHSALTITIDSTRWTIEMAPVWNLPVRERGTVCVGPVGARVLGISRWFRYEVRCWRDGIIPDAGEAVGGPQRVCDDPACASAMLALAPSTPPLTWGRDERHVGDMWNSNSLVAWLLAATGHDTTAFCPPGGGRAPGWDAGVALAHERGRAVATHGVA